MMLCERPEPKRRRKSKNGWPTFRSAATCTKQWRDTPTAMTLGRSTASSGATWNSGCATSGEQANSWAARTARPSAVSAVG